MYKNLKKIFASIIYVICVNNAYQMCHLAPKWGKKKKSVNKKSRVSWCKYQSMQNMLIIFVKCIIASMPTGTQMGVEKKE